MVKPTLVPNVLPNFILVIDRTIYRNIHRQKQPTSNPRKPKSVAICDNMVKAHLFNLITLNKPKHKCD
jgi:hypothetical protein